MPAPSPGGERASPRFAAPRVEREPLPDGGFVLRHPEPLRPHAATLGALLEAAARDTGDRDFLVERDPLLGRDAPLRRLGYAAALDRVLRLGGALLARGASRERPVLLLSDNAIDHALVQLAAMHVGAPAVPVSPAYSLVSRDHARLRAIVELVDPAVVYAEDGAKFERALAAIDRAGPSVVTSRAPVRGAALLDELVASGDRESAREAFATTGPDTIAKILFTSGSTGVPKGVVTTHRMMCSNQEAIAMLWPFLEERPPIVVDWLPWSHVFGGSHNFNLVVRNRGTLVVDRGKPTPELVGETASLLREVSPTLYFNVPRGFDALLPMLEGDEALRESFFRDLDLLFYAAAALPDATWERLERVSERALGRKVTMVSAWGSTETSPLVTQVHYAIDRAGVIGNPAPGLELRFAKSGDRFEMRVRGPCVTPGYWRKGGSIEPAPLDELGFFAMGDAGKLRDERDPAKGVVFDGRTAENFKLTSGTWVAVGELRVRLVSKLAPLVVDLAITGEGRDGIGALVFANEPLRKSMGDAAYRAELEAKIRAYNEAHPQATSCLVGAYLESEPPAIDHGEITDKGYMNQRATLARRADHVAAIYAAAAGAGVLR